MPSKQPHVPAINIVLGYKIYSLINRNCRAAVKYKLRRQLFKNSFEGRLYTVLVENKITAIEPEMIQLLKKVIDIVAIEKKGNEKEIMEKLDKIPINYLHYGDPTKALAALMGAEEEFADYLPKLYDYWFKRCFSTTARRLLRKTFGSINYGPINKDLKLLVESFLKKKIAPLQIPVKEATLYFIAIYKKISGKPDDIIIDGLSYNNSSSNQETYDAQIEFLEKNLSIFKRIATNVTITLLCFILTKSFKLTCRELRMSFKEEYYLEKDILECKYNLKKVMISGISCFDNKCKIHFASVLLKDCKKAIRFRNINKLIDMMPYAINKISHEEFMQELKNCLNDSRLQEEGVVPTSKTRQKIWLLEINQRLNPESKTKYLKEKLSLCTRGFLEKFFPSRSNYRRDFY